MDVNMIDNLIPITDAKAKLPEIVRLAGENIITVLTRHGRPAALVIGTGHYAGLIEELEELKDRLSVFESRDRGPDARIPFDRVLVELGYAGDDLSPET